MKGRPALGVVWSAPSGRRVGQFAGLLIIRPREIDGSERRPEPVQPAWRPPPVIERQRRALRQILAAARQRAERRRGPRTATARTAGPARWPRRLPRFSPHVGARSGIPRGTCGVHGSWTGRTRTEPPLQPWPCARRWRPNGSGPSRSFRHFTTTSTRSSRLDVVQRR
jgi:hypothetical protein